MDDEAHVLVERHGPIAVVTLHRPDHLNAFTGRMGQELSAAYADLDADDAVRAIVLTGAGRAFCAGADLSNREVFSAGAAQGATFRSSPVRPAAFELRTPVIAAVNGHAIGLGMTLALQCDLRIMSATAKWGVVQPRRGVVGDAHSHWTTPRVAGFANAVEILLMGRTYLGTDALRLGVANAVVEADQVLTVALEWARELSEQVAPVSAALAKRMLWRSLDAGPDEIDHLEHLAHLATMGSDDSREGPAAFFDKRTPAWNGKVSARWPEGFGEPTR